MKRILLVIAICFGVLTGFAQDEKSAIDLKNEGNAALKAKEYKKALGLFEKSLAKWEDETDLAMVYNTGYCAYRSKDYKKAAKYFEMSITNKYKTSKAFLYKADALRKAGDDAGYESTLTAGIAANPNDSGLKAKLAKYYLISGNKLYKAGAQILKDAAADVTAGKYKTTDSQYKAALNKSKEEFKKALPLFDKALEITPDDSTAKQLKAACEQNIKG